MADPPAAPKWVQELRTLREWAQMSPSSAPLTGEPNQLQRIQVIQAHSDQVSMSEFDLEEYGREFRVLKESKDEGLIGAPPSYPPLPLPLLTFVGVRR